jgi:hypothetical protein
MHSVFFSVVSAFCLFRIGSRAMNRLNILKQKFEQFFLHHFYLIKLEVLFKRIPPNNLPILKNQYEIRKIVFLFLCMAFCLVWFLTRKSDWSWILQDIMIIAIVVNTLSFTVFKAYKYAVIFTFCFYIYELVMIFAVDRFVKVR